MCFQNELRDHYSSLIELLMRQAILSFKEKGHRVFLNYLHNFKSKNIGI